MSEGFLTHDDFTRLLETNNKMLMLEFRPMIEDMKELKDDMKTVKHTINGNGKEGLLTRQSNTELRCETIMKRQERMDKVNIYAIIGIFATAIITLVLKTLGWI